MVLTEEQKAIVARNRAEAIRRAALRVAREKAEAEAVASTSTVTTTMIQNQNQNQKREPMMLTKSNDGKKQPLMTNFVWKNSTTQTNKNISKPTIDVKLKLFTSNRVKIEFYPFHSSIIDGIKQIGSKSYDPDTKTWTISISDIQAATETLKRIQTININIESIPQNVLELLNLKLKSAPEDLSTVMDPNLIKQLFPYQKEGIRFALERNGRILLADEMGLGKSVQALTIARYYKADWPLLIVCPASVKGAWKKQLNKFFPAVQKIFIVDKSSDPLPEARTSNTVAIMSYEQMCLKYDQLKKDKYLTIIFDESHMLKDTKAKRTKTAMELAKIALHVILLSGTPALSRPSELYSQIRLIDPKIFPKFTDFAIRYCDGKQGRFCFEAKGCTNSEELAVILFKRIMIRRLKIDVLKDLPEKRREVVHVSGPSISERMEDLQKARSQYDSLNSGSGSSAHNRQECLLEYFSLTGIVKAAAVCEHILDNYFYPDAPQRKLLIFAHHQIVLDTIEAGVNKKKLKSIRIDGKTPSHQRTALCDSFQNPNDGVQVAILSLTAAGVGITLTAASVVVFAEIHFNPGMLLQAEDRAHRVGQKDSVFVQYLIAKNTADDVMWAMVQKKLDVLGQVNLSSDTFRTAEKTHICFVDEAALKTQPSVTKYFGKTSSSTDIVDEWSDPCEEEEEEQSQQPVTKRSKF